MRSEDTLLQSISSRGFKTIKDTSTKAKYLAERGHTVREIAGVLDCAVGTAYRWISGTNRSIKKGRPPLLNAEEERELIQLIRSRASERKPFEYKDVRDQES